MVRILLSLVLLAGNQFSFLFVLNRLWRHPGLSTLLERVDEQGADRSRWESRQQPGISRGRYRPQDQLYVDRGSQSQGGSQANGEL